MVRNIVAVGCSCLYIPACWQYKITCDSPRTVVGADGCHQYKPRSDPAWQVYAVLLVVIMKILPLSSIMVMNIAMIAKGRIAKTWKETIWAGTSRWVVVGFVFEGMHAQALV